jgi:hypothetical protein
MTERAPDADQSHDPADRDVSDQLPEEGPGGQAPRQGDPEQGADAPAAPDTSHPEEGDPDQATGNPRAAG